MLRKKLALHTLDRPEIQILTATAAPAPGPWVVGLVFVSVLASLCLIAVRAAHAAPTDGCQLQKSQVRYRWQTTLDGISENSRPQLAQVLQRPRTLSRLAARRPSGAGPTSVTIQIGEVRLAGLNRRQTRWVAELRDAERNGACLATCAVRRDRNLEQTLSFALDCEPSDSDGHSTDETSGSDPIQTSVMILVQGDIAAMNSQHSRARSPAATLHLGRWMNGTHDIALQANLR